MSIENTNPETLFGGTWVKIKDTFLLASGTNTLGSTGGNSSVSYTPSGTVGNHTLTVNEMPSHTHFSNDLFSGYATPNDRRGMGSYISYSKNTNNYTKPAVDQLSKLDTTFSSTGGSQPHSHSFTGKTSNINTMPPYLVVNVWKRTALHSSFFLYLFFILLYNYYGDNMKKILMVLMSLIIITGCGDVTINIYKDYKTTDKVEISSKKTKTFKNLTYDEYTKKLANKDSFVLFIWQTGCSHCESFEPKLNNIISYYNMDIYGLNLRELTEEEYAMVKNKTFVTGTPALVYFSEGAYDTKLVGDKEEEDVLDFLVEIGYLKEK